MLTFVGAMSGYCSTGSEKNAPIPPSITMIARTQAKIGRSMNIRDMAELSAPACAAASRRGDVLRRARRHRADFHSVADVVAEALGDHAVAGLEAVGADRVAPARACRRDLAAHRLVRGIDDEDEGAAADVALQCRLRDEECARLDRLVEHRLHEHAG